MASIYLIKSKTSGKCYIGQTNSTAEKRWKKHLVELRRREGCRALYSAIKKYGESDFIVTTLESGNFDRKKLNELEKNYIHEQKTLSPLGYNLTTGGDFVEDSVETRKRKSEALKGRRVTWGSKVSLGVKKLWNDPEYRKKMVDAHTGERGYKYKKHTKPLRLVLDDKKIKGMYKSGITINKISKILGVSFGVIKRRI